MMRVTLKWVLIVTAAVLLCSSQAWATPFLLGTASKDYLGNFGDSTIQGWLTGLIINYNTLYDPNLPTDVVGATPDIKVGKETFGEGITSITLRVDQNDYLVLHWGGKNGGIVQAYALNTDFSDTYWTFIVPEGYGGLSFYSYYGTVPEPGTVLLLGFGLAGLYGYGLRKRAKR